MFQRGVFVENFQGEFACGREHDLIFGQVGNFQIEYAALLCAGEVAGAAQVEIDFGDFKTIVGAHHRFQTCATVFADFDTGHENAIALFGAASDTTA